MLDFKNWEGAVTPSMRWRLEFRNAWRRKVDEEILNFLIGEPRVGDSLSTNRRLMRFISVVVSVSEKRFVALSSS